MTTLRTAVALSCLAAAVSLHGQQPSPGSSEDFRFKTGVELVNVAATVTDVSGRFVAGLHQEDFAIFDDGQPQTISHFSADRVPVSLGLVLDTSGSMAGDKIDAARGAINRLLYDLLDKDDEVFLYEFNDYPRLIEGWTKDRTRVSSAVTRIVPTGGTAMYDAVAEAIPLAGRGSNQKKAVVVISDGNDTSSRIGTRDLKQMIRESEVLVYAVGIDGPETLQGPPPYRTPQRPPSLPPMPFPFPRRGPRFPAIRPAQIFGGGGRRPTISDSRVNSAALQELTDDSGGRTEIIREARNLDPATAGIVDELSKQYSLGYTPTGKRDGRWHPIRVEIRDHNYRVRARRGYVAN